MSPQHNPIISDFGLNSCPWTSQSDLFGLIGDTWTPKLHHEPMQRWFLSAPFFHVRTHCQCQGEGDPPPSPGDGKTEFRAPAPDQENIALPPAREHGKSFDGVPGRRRTAARDRVLRSKAHVFHILRPNGHQPTMIKGSLHIIYKR